MARYLFEVSYTVEGLKGVIAAGATSRVKVVQNMAANLGGSMVTFDFAFGGTDVYTICDLPDDEAAAAVGLTVGASGAVSKIHTVKLLSPEQVEAAATRNAGYVPPSG